MLLGFDAAGLKTVGIFGYLSCVAVVSWLRLWIGAPSVSFLLNMISEVNTKSHSLRLGFCAQVIRNLAVMSKGIH